MTFANFVTGIISIINTVIIPIIFALAFLVFIWGTINYLFIHGGDEGKRSEGRQFMAWGILGMVVLLSVWGFVNVILSTLGIAPGA